MGDSAVQSRAQRFIEEFNTDVTEALGMASPAVETQGLGFDEVFNTVRFYISMYDSNGTKRELILDEVYFGIDGDDENLIENLSTLLSASEESIEERLRKINLLDAA